MYGPFKLDESHKRDLFDCGKSMPNNFIRKYACINEDNGSSTTYVFIDDDNRVIAYFTLVPCSASRAELTPGIAIGLPKRKRGLPIYLLGLFAIDNAYQGKGLSDDFLKEVFLTVLEGAKTMNAVALVVDALDKEAREFWIYKGFQQSPLNEDTLMVPIKYLRATFGS